MFKKINSALSKIQKLPYKKTILIFFGILFFIFFTNDTRLSQPHIARINIENIIVQDNFRYEKLSELSENKNTKAVIAHINSPGGTVVGGETLYKSIKKIAENKPFVSIMGELATSAAYMASIGSEYIFAQEGKITGSVGVLVLSSEYTELSKKIGISTEIIKSGNLKAVPSPVEKLTPEARDATQRIVSEMSNNFINLVKIERDLKPATVDLISDGRIFTGKLAKKLNLIDEIGNLEEAQIYLKKKHNIINLPVVDYKIIKEDSWIEEFTSNLTGNFNLSKLLNLHGLVSIWITN